MSELLRELAAQVPLAVLLVVVAGSILLLSKGADILVAEAVALSRRFNVRPVIIGATIVSLGTTTPEAAVSVLSAIEGDPGLALGNAVGSVTANAALIVGVAALIAPIPVDRVMLRRQGAIQYGSAILLVLVSLPFASGEWVRLVESGNRVPRFAGVAFLVLLAAYLLASVRWARVGSEREQPALVGEAAVVSVPHTTVQTLATVTKLAGGLALVVAASQILIPAVEASALRLGVPRAVVAASLVALGTSLPELVTAITASRKGHGELALGNVVGANVLNVLFVVGLSAAVTPGGLRVGPEFVVLLYPAMLVSGAFLYAVAGLGRRRIDRTPGLILVVLYVAAVAAGYAV
ncbi:MAG: sodium:calcium antiporter [Spirochaetota bacterium]